MMRIVACLFVSLAACQPAPVGVHNVELQRDSTAQCASQCQEIGLALDSVVIMAARVGCVCRPAQPMPNTPPTTVPPASPAAASGTAGGVTAVIMDEEAAAAAYQHQMQQQQQQRQQTYQPKY